MLKTAHDIAGANGAEKMLDTRRYRGLADWLALDGFRVMAKLVTFNLHVHLLLHPIAVFAARAIKQGLLQSTCCRAPRSS